MKINELDFLKEDEGENYMDLTLHARQDPADDAFIQQSDEHRRRPVITLRHINKLKRMKLAQRMEEEERKILLGLMYATSTSEEEA